MRVKFDIQQFIDALGTVNNGDEVILNLTGEMEDGSTFWGSDIDKILKRGNR